MTGGESPAWVGTAQRKSNQTGGPSQERRGEPGEGASGDRKGVARAGSEDRPLGTRWEGFQWLDGAEPEWPGVWAAEGAGGYKHPLPDLGQGQHKALGARAGMDCSRRGVPEPASGGTEGSRHSPGLLS